MKRTSGWRRQCVEVLYGIASQWTNCARAAFFVVLFGLNFTAKAGFDIHVFRLQYGSEYSVITLRRTDGPTQSYTAPTGEVGTKRNHLAVSPGVSHKNYQQPKLLTDPSYGAFADKILDLAQSWLLNYYVERKVVAKDAKLYDEIKEVETIKDGRSSLVIITDLNNPSKIHAMLRVSTRIDSNGKDELPLEKRLQAHLERPSAQNDLYVEGYGTNPLQMETRLNTNVASEMPDNFQISKPVYGDVVELKNFAVEKGLSEDLIPLLLYTAEVTGIATQGIAVNQANVATDAEWNSHPSVKEYVEHVAGRGLGNPLLSEMKVMHTSKYVLPSQYVIECLPPMERYYRRMGFVKVNEYSNNEISVMQMPRDGFKKLVQSFASGWRDQARKNSDVRFKYMWTDQDWQELMDHVIDTHCGGIFKNRN